MVMFAAGLVFGFFLGIVVLLAILYEMETT